jgi:hypothetical protein
MYYLRDGLKSPIARLDLRLCRRHRALTTTTPFTQPNSIAIVFDHVWPSGEIIGAVLGVVHPHVRCSPASSSR